MSDAFNESPGGAREPRRDKPLTLAGIEPTQNLKNTSCHSHHTAASSSFTSSSSSFTSHSTSCSASTSSSRSSCIAPTASAADVVASPAPSVRIRDRSRVCGSDGNDERDRSCDDVAGSNVRAAAFPGSGNNGKNEEVSAAGYEASSRRQSLNLEDTSPSSHSFGKSLLGRTSRFASGCGATTRKCVLTLDGYSYVIVASTPENRPSRDDNKQSNSSSPTSIGSCGATAFGTSSSCAGSGGTTTTTGTPNSLTYAQAINGQVAKHGSLTIVRRSNSRKSFTQSDAQPTASAAPTTVFDSTPHSTAHNTATSSDNRDKYSYDNANFVATEVATPLLRGAYSSNSGAASTSSSTSNRTSTTATKAKDQNLLQFTSSMQIGSSTSNSNNVTTNSNINSSSSNINVVTTTGRMTPTTATDEDTTTQASALGTVGDAERVGADGGNDESGTGNEPVTPTTVASVDLATENLPAVDTPDACDKAAVRLRCLLRLLNTGEISAEVLQKNLHYAARVLEAVFLDETKSPAFNKSKSGQNSYSSAVCEDQPEVASCKNSARCNGNCKNLNCSNHEHNHCSSSSSILQNNNNNNNATSSCTLELNDNQPQELTSEMTSHNQSIAIESRTKGVSLAPQTHSGPTGPPEKDEPVTEESGGATETETAKQNAANAVETVAVAAAADVGGEGSTQDIGTSSSNSNKATVQRQRRLRTPVWARSMSTNKTYSCPKWFSFNFTLFGLTSTFSMISKFCFATSCNVFVGKLLQMITL